MSPQTLGLNPRSVLFRRFRHTQSHPWKFEDLLNEEVAVLTELNRYPKSSHSPVIVLLSEVAPVVTVTRRTALERDLRGKSPSDFSAHGISIHEVNRGGLTTYHGPGQWVLFALGALESLTGSPTGVRKMVHGLLQVTLLASKALLEEQDQAALAATLHVREGAELGVWLQGKLGPAKVASVGIRVEKGMVRHGVAVNIFETPQTFWGINPCGLEGARAGTLLGPGAEAQACFERAGDLLELKFCEEFKRDRVDGGAAGGYKQNSSAHLFGGS